MDTLKIFCSYASADKGLMESFHAHVRRVLELQHVSIWYTHDIQPGVEWERERDNQLHAAHIILFLVSSDFIASNEHYQKEVVPAMQRYTEREANVIPIILRPVEWEKTALGGLTPLPNRGRPITDPIWQTQDHAFLNTVNGIQAIIDHRNDVTPRGPIDFPRDAASAQLAQIMQNFKALRGEIASFVMMRGPKDFTMKGCETRYNKLYGDTMVFLATYLPESVSDDSEGFVEIVYRKTAERMHRDNPFDLFTTFVARTFIPFLAQIEKLALQIDACIATLESYQQKYFSE
jgi:hypothetical protein